MAISSTDDMGAYTDTGVGTTPTQRPSERADIHILVPALASLEKDTGTASGTSINKIVPSPSRSVTQRR